MSAKWLSNISLFNFNKTNNKQNFKPETVSYNYMEVCQNNWTVCFIHIFI
ncbi:hypothetical protein [Plasmodium yoelii yoelii]|uniref:Uncharacterized protein n=1 Tax=Plasmodium yoelii yoelii TaxID=73239 RepID=Q7RIA4_PLAYO|nr:hypothetical protein [Plasmodium yoelii yoelii]